MPDANKITVAGYKEALSALERNDKISENQMTWLKAYNNAPDQVITATELAEMVGFKG